MSLRPPEDDLIELGRPALGSPRPADTAVLAWAAAAGLMADLAARAGLASLGMALLVVTGSLGIVLSGRVRRTRARVAALAAPIFGSWLLVRSSTWLIVPDMLAAVGLLALAATVQTGFDLFDVDVPAWLRRASSALVHSVGGAAFVLGGARTSIAERDVGHLRIARLRPLVRGLVVAVPVILILGALLRSADPVFASFIAIHLNGGDLLAHALLVALGTWAMGGLLRLASVTSFAPPSPSRARLGMTEALVVLGAVDFLFGLFAVAQLVAVAGGENHVLRTTGLTYSQYARSGYFQLLWVAGLTLALLVALDTVVDRPPRKAGGAFGIAGALASGLTVLVGVVAFRRLTLYENAFGLTMLRLSCQVFAVWITVVFGLLALSLLGAWHRRHWFVGSALVAGLVVLLAFNATNPEAVVADHNLGQGSLADVSYLATLSADAVPTILARVGELGPVASESYLTAVCDRHQYRHGWASFNLSRSQADRALARVCQQAG